MGEISVTSKKNITKIDDSNTIALRANRKFVYNPKRNGNLLLTGLTAVGKFRINTVGAKVREEDVKEMWKDQPITLDGTGKWNSMKNGDTYTSSVLYENLDTGIKVTGTVYNGDIVKFKYNNTPNEEIMKIIQTLPLDVNFEIHNIEAQGFKIGFNVTLTPYNIRGVEADENGNVEVLSGNVNNRFLYMVSPTGAIKTAPFVYNTSTDEWTGRLPATGGTLLLTTAPLKTSNTTGTQNGTTDTTQTPKPNNPSTGFAVDLSAAVIK